MSFKFQEPIDITIDLGLGQIWSTLNDFMWYQDYWNRWTMAYLGFGEFLWNDAWSGELGTAADELETQTAGTVATVGIAGIGSLSWIGSNIWSGIEWLAGWITENLDKLFHTLHEKIHQIHDAVKKVLERIHFKTLLKIHRIAEIVSPQYRALSRKIYRKIARISEALGFGPYLIHILLEDARDVTHDVAAIFGSEWDLGEVEWLATKSEWLKRFSKDCKKYQHDPELLLFDIAQSLKKPPNDRKGEFLGLSIQGWDKTLEFADKLGGQIAAAGMSIATFNVDLSNFVSGKIPDLSEAFWKPFNGFLNTYYNPTINGLQSEVKTWKAAAETNTADVEDLVERLKHPGKILTSIKNAPVDERLEAETYISDLAEAPAVKWRDLFMPIVDVARGEMETMIRTPLPTIPAPGILRLEPIPAHVPGLGKVKPRSTWFVGDY